MVDLGKRYIDSSVDGSDQIYLPLVRQSDDVQWRRDLLLVAVQL